MGSAADNGEEVVVAEDDGALGEELLVRLALVRGALVDPGDLALSYCYAFGLYGGFLILIGFVF